MLFRSSPSAKLLDVGCSDGERTTRWAKQIGTNDVVGIDAKDMDYLLKINYSMLLQLRKSLSMSIIPIYL